MICRTTGVVLSTQTEHLRGKRSGDPYTKHTLRILVLDEEMVIVQAFGEPGNDNLVTRDGESLPQKGDQVDLRCVIESFGNAPQATFAGHWPGGASGSKAAASKVGASV